MAKGRNFMVRAFDALIADRERQARRYVERHMREHGQLNDKLTKR